MERLSEWISIFTFTFKQQTKGKAFRVSTMVIALCLFSLGAITCIYMADSQKKKENRRSDIQVVYVIDESKLLSQWIETNGKLKDKKAHIRFIKVDIPVEEIKKADVWNAYEGDQKVFLYLERSLECDRVQLFVLKNSSIRIEDQKELLNDICEIIDQNRQKLAGLDTAQMAFINDTPVSSLRNAGEEEKEFGEIYLGYMIPLFVAFFLFLMILVHAEKSLCVVSLEKTSKLMETFMVLTTPENLFLGKVFAVALTAILQTICWVIGLLCGFVVGNIVADKFLYPGYKNVLFDILNTIKLHGNGKIFTSGGFLISFVFLCLSFLFYCALAAGIGSLATKAEDLPELTRVYNAIMIFSWLPICYYLSTLKRGAWFEIILRIAPVTSGFVLSGDVIMGKITPGEILLYALILLFFTVFVVFLTGKIYQKNRFRKRSIKKISQQ